MRFFEGLLRFHDKHGNRLYLHPTWISEASSGHHFQTTLVDNSGFPSSLRAQIFRLLLKISVEENSWMSL